LVLGDELAVSVVVEAGNAVAVGGAEGGAGPGRLKAGIGLFWGGAVRPVAPSVWRQGRRRH